MGKKDVAHIYNGMKSSLEGINSRITEAEERISDLEDRMVEFTAAEQNKKKSSEKPRGRTGIKTQT